MTSPRSSDLRAAIVVSLSIIASQWKYRQRQDARSHGRRRRGTSRPIFSARSLALCTGRRGETSYSQLACPSAPMSALGQKQTPGATSNQCPLYPRKRTWISTFVMSALCQKQTSCDAAKSGLLDHLVGADEQCRRHGDPERFSRLKIDNYVKFGRPLDRKFARLRTLQNLVNKSRCPIVHIRKVDAQGNEASCPCKFRKAARWQSIHCSKNCERVRICDQHRIFG